MSLIFFLLFIKLTFVSCVCFYLRSLLKFNNYVPVIILSIEEEGEDLRK